MAADSLIILMNLILVIKISGIIYSVVIRISWVAYSYFERLVFFFSGVLILLMIIPFFNIALSNSILRRMIPFLRSGVNDRYIGYNITNIYYLDFLIGVVFNKMTLLSVL